MTPLNRLIRFAGVAMFVALLLFSAGCYGSKETDDLAYVLVIGVDKAAGGKNKVTYQIALPPGKSSGGKDKKGGEKVPWILSTILTPSTAETRMLLNSTISRYPSVTHMHAYVFSEEMAREGLNPRVSYIVRSREFRESMFLIVVPGSAEEYIKQNKPTLEDQIHKFYEKSRASEKYGSYYQLAQFHDFYTRLKNFSGSPYTAYSAINPMTGKDNPAGSKTPEQKGDPYLPGGVPRDGTANPVDFLGLAVFRGDKMVGVLNSEETRAVAILQGKFTSGYIGVVDPLQTRKDAINVNIRFDPKPQITADLNGGAPIFHVKLKIEGEIIGITSSTNYEAPDYRELLEAQIANLFNGQLMNMIKHTQELGTDPVGFSLYLRPQFRNTDEMEQADMTALYQAADFRVTITAKMRRTGYIWRASPKRTE